MNKIIAFLVYLAGIISGVVFLGLWEKAVNSKSEYVTASVVRSVEEFFVKNDRWPRSWDDLGLPNQDEHVQINFSLDVSIADRLDVFNAINTKNGKWLTYPHRVIDTESLATQIKNRQNNARRDR